MTAFKDAFEIFRCLTDGGKIRHADWGQGEYLHVSASEGLCDEKGHQFAVNFGIPQDWSPYVEPKKKKTVKMYPALARSVNQYLVSDELFETEKDAQCTFPNIFVRWLNEEKYAVEVEIEE